MAKMEHNKGLSEQKKSAFVRGVNNLVVGHEGNTIDEFRVSFDDNFICEADVKKWVGFALDKQVKILDLDLVRNVGKSLPCCSLPFECCRSLEQPLNLSKSKHPLTSLRLNNVNVTTQVVDCFLRCCPHLENLSIQNSKSLEIIRVSGASLPLKHLTIYACENIKIIDISVPKLMSFKYRNSKLMELNPEDVPSELKELHIRDASSLQEVLLQCCEETLSTALDSLSNYFSQLEYFNLTIYSSFEVHLFVDRFYALSRLKHLKLTVVGSPNGCVLGWTPLIEASPILEKLTLKMVRRPLFNSSCIQERCKNGRASLMSLKTLNIRHFSGSPFEVQLLTYIMENAITLEDVLVQVDFMSRDVGEIRSIPKDNSPSDNCGVKLIFVERRDDMLRKNRLSTTKTCSIPCNLRSGQNWCRWISNCLSSYF